MADLDWNRLFVDQLPCSAKLTAKRKEANLSASLEMGKVQGCAIAGIQSIETIKAGGQEITFYTKFGGLSRKGHEFNAAASEFVTRAKCSPGICQANDRSSDPALAGLVSWKDK